MHGCYPVSIDKIREIARNEGPEEAESFIDKNQPRGEPYVGSEADPKHHRVMKIVASSQGTPMDTYIATLSIIENQHDYDARKVGEWLHTQPGSQLHQEMMQRRQTAEQQIGRTVSNLADMYHQKHLLEHDIRKLEQKAEHFDDRDEAALKADFVDTVDQHTGRSSIIQMQANDIFPSITADFYNMDSLSDLTGDGQLADLPEQEKATLRKKWKLYEKWKEKFGNAVHEKLEDVERRLRSVEKSIEQYEEWMKPYVQAIQQMEGDAAAKIEEMTDPYMVEGYSSSMRGIKVVAHKPVRKDENDEGDEIVTHRDVIVLNVAHVQLGGSEQPQAAGQGGEVVVLTFQEYTVCEHIFQEVFQPQIEQRENEVKRFVKEYVGEEVPMELEPHTVKSFEPYETSSPRELKHNVMRWFGLGDAYFHPDPSDLRAGLLGPAFGGGGCPLYIDIKYTVGFYVMK